MRHDLAVVLVFAAVCFASCAPDGDGVSWEGDRLAPTGKESLEVEAWRFGSEPVRLDVPVFAASHQRWQVAADGTLYVITENALEVGTSRYDLPSPEGLSPLVLSSPAYSRMGEFVAYNLIDDQAPAAYDAPIRGQRLTWIRGGDSSPVEPINLQDYGVEPEAAVRGDVVAHWGEDMKRVYVATGSALGGPVVKGRVFAVDPEAWARGNEPVVAQFVVTGRDGGRCQGANTRSDGACGGGLHGEAALGVRVDEGGLANVILATGKGATDVLDGDFANGVLRLSRDLEFDPGCDVEVCEATGGSSPECLSTCRNFFVPRGGASDSSVPAPLRDTCTRAETFNCLERAAFDGSSAPIGALFEPSGGDERSPAMVWAAPDGFLYALDPNDWSKDVRRAKYAYVCNSDDPECEIPAHTPATTPVRSSDTLRTGSPGVEIGAQSVIWIPSYSPINGVPAGVSQFDLVGAGGGPAIAHLRSSPPRSSRAARTRFRYRPSRITRGAVIESGNSPRFFRPFYYVNGDVRGVDVRLRTDGGFASAAYTRPVKIYLSDEWYFHVRDDRGSLMEGLQLRHPSLYPILE